MDLVPKLPIRKVFLHHTRWMNAILKDILRSGASELRDILDNGGSVEEARAHKDKRVEDIWKIPCIHLGTPPEEFDWQWEDKDGELQERKYEKKNLLKNTSILTGKIMFVLLMIKEMSTTKLTQWIISRM